MPAKSMTRKPTPLIPDPPRKLCPVCGEVAYSMGGIHPQCAVRKADEQRLLRSRRATKPGKVPKSAKLSAWQRQCKKCRAIVHVRKLICDCGQVLSSAQVKSSPQ